MKFPLFLGFPVLCSLLVSCASQQLSRTEAEEVAVLVALSAYEAKFGAPPVGDDQKIMDALRGKGPYSLVFIELPPEALDASGRFVDPWGTPYAFERTKRDLAVRSAGKDKIHHTADDVVNGACNR